MTDLERRAAIQRIVAALDGFDDDLLRQLDGVIAAPIDGWTAGEPSGLGEAPAGLSRRQAISGSAALAVLALATARWLAGTRDETIAVGAGDSLLLSLYRALGADDLDAAARAALEALALHLAGTVETVKALAGGLDTVAAGLAAAEGALPPLRDGVARAEAVLGQLAAAMAQVIDAVPSIDVDAAPGDPSVSALPRALAHNAQAAADAIGGWLAEAADALPFGLGDTLRARLEAVRQVIVLVPETLSAVDGALLGPLRAQWLPADDAPGAGIEAALFEPLHRGVLDNGLALVAAAAELAAWRAGAEAELAAMLARRAETLRRIEAAEGV